MDDAYIINSRMDHRGGCGFEENTGDGAGILLALPHEFFKEEAQKLKINLPEKGKYAVGNIFFPQKKSEKKFCKKIIEDVLKKEKLEFLGWRKVPIDSVKADVGPALWIVSQRLNKFLSRRQRISTKMILKENSILKKNIY